METTKMLEPVIERLQSDANVKTVFGAPFESHGKTLVPVATVAYGFGGGSGEGKHHGENGEHGEGGGIGGGVRTSPAGVLEITEGKRDSSGSAPIGSFWAPSASPFFWNPHGKAVGSRSNGGGF